MMNIYFSPNQHNEMNFPTSNIPATTINRVTKAEEANSNISESLTNEEREISQFYKKYGSTKKKFEKTKAQKKLNKIKVYFIVKSKIVKGKEVKYALPIRSFDDLGNSILEKSNAFIASIFYLKVDNNTSGQDFHEGSPDSRPFRLDDLVHPEPPFDAEQEFSLEKLVLPKKYKIDGMKSKTSLDSGVKNPREMVIEDRSFQDTFGEIRSLFELFSEYEYNYSMIDNTFLINSSRYGTDSRQKSSFSGEKEETGFLSRFNELNTKEGTLKLFNISNIFSIFFGNTSSAMDKNIIPIFSNLEDAQDLLITILEEINQPFQVRRKVNNLTTSSYSKSLNYLDDSFSFQNHYLLPNPNSKIERIKDFLRKYRTTKSLSLANDSEANFYHENNYQTKGPFFLEDTGSVDNDVYVPMSQQTKSAPKSIWREIDYWSFLDRYFPGQPEEYSWWESRDMTDTDKGLLRKSQDVKIIAMGLGDFLEFWNNPMKKNAEALFVPSSKDFNNKKLTLFPKKSRDRFYDYQQKFRTAKPQETQKYSYDIKISS